MAFFLGKNLASNIQLIYEYCLPMIHGRIIPKTEKIVLDASLLNTQHYKVRIKGKWSDPGKGVVPSPTCQYYSYWKGSRWVTFHTTWLIN